MVSYLIQGAALGFAAAAAPGAYQSYLITKTLHAGWRQAIVIALAPLISDPPIVLAVLLLLDQISDRWIDIISLFGGIFIFYMAWGIWQSLRKPETPGRQTQTSDGRTNFHYSAPQSDNAPAGSLAAQRWRILKRAVLMNMLSPGLYTFWIFVLGPLFLEGFAVSPFQGGAFLLGFYGVFISSLSALVLLFHQARRLGPRIVHALTVISLLILTLMGFLLILDSLSGQIDAF